MASVIKLEEEFNSVPSSKAKTLRINLNPNIYGTFSEIGAGQETARYFFRAGGASGTIAKAMSAYDKDFSDAIYGREEDGRYVTQSRLKKMLSHEMNLMEQRLSEHNPNKLFFSYANTVATIDFAKKFKGHGWVGIRYQLSPGQKEYNEIILHIRFKQNEARLQQETLGILGVNLIYGAFFTYDKPKMLLKYLYDHLDKDVLEIDMVNFSGPNFKNVDNRLMSLLLVKNGMTDAVMFGPDGQNLLPAAVLYKKNILAMRGRFRPVTVVNEDMLAKSMEIFQTENSVDPNNTMVIFEITLSNLMVSGEIDEQDFLDRADLLCHLGHNVIISNFQEYYKLVEYFNKYTKERIGLTMGINNLEAIFDEKYYRHLSGGILEAFGKLFFKNLKVYLYPMKNEVTGEIITSNSLKVHPRMKELYKFFKYNGKVMDIIDYDPEVLGIMSGNVFEKISKKDNSWERMVPEGIVALIKEKNLFSRKEKKAEKILD